VAVNDDGDAVVAWGRADDGAANGQGDIYVSLFTDGIFSAPIPVLESGDNVAGIGRLEVVLDDDGLPTVSGDLRGEHSAWRMVSGSPDWTRLASIYDSDEAPREGAAVALDDDGVVHMCADYDWGSIGVVRTTMPEKTRYASRVSDMFDPHCALSGTEDVVGTWLMRGASATTESVWAIAYDHDEDDWALAATDLFPGRGVDDQPSPPDVAAYLDTGALIVWTADGQLSWRLAFSISRCR
jgi:hypothetical protein